MRGTGARQPYDFLLYSHHRNKLPKIMTFIARGRFFQYPAGLELHLLQVYGVLCIIDCIGQSRNDF